MHLKSLNGKLIKINLKCYVANRDYCKSKFQHQVKLDLMDKHPNDLIFEEVYIPIENFYLDLFIPSLSMVIEVQGKQHQEHIRFFHRTISDFNKQKNTDDRKRRWCSLNNLKLVEVYG